MRQVEAGVSGEKSNEHESPNRGTRPGGWPGEPCVVHPW